MNVVCEQVSSLNQEIRINSYIRIPFDTNIHLEEFRSLRYHGISECDNILHILMKHGRYYLIRYAKGTM